MIVTHDNTDTVVLENVKTVGEFRIRNSARAFSILSSGLYSNKIKAIIRELSCNAIDSHVAAGKASTPFEIHIPTLLEPWFSVRDFGTGLDNNQVVNIYTTYFESTKTNSNDFIGALGLGSKSPFSYTENFNVTAIKNGIKRIYSAFINDVGVPSIVEMSSDATDEGNGVEVKFSVTKSADFLTFKNEVADVLMWFSNKPIITGVSSFYHKTIEYNEKNICPGVHSRNTMHGLLNCSYAVMGNIPYPLNNIPDSEKHLGELSKLLNCNLILEFNIGELDFAASREQLSYVPITIASIKNKLEILNKSLILYIEKEIDKISGEWSKAEYLYGKSTNPLFRAAVFEYVKKVKFELFDVTQYGGKKTFQLDLDTLSAQGIEIESFSTYGNGKSAKSKYTVTSTRKASSATQLSRHWNIPVDPSVVIVLNDLKSGCYDRARYRYVNSPGYSRVFCITHRSKSDNERNNAYTAFLKDLHNPPVVLKASEFSVRPKSKTVSSHGIMVLKEKNPGAYKSESSYTWEPYTGSINDTDMYTYVMLDNRKSIDQKGQYVNMFQIRSWMDTCGIQNIADIKIFGVRKNKIKDIQPLKNWVPYDVRLQQEVSVLTDKQLLSLVTYDVFDGYYDSVYTNKAVAEKVDDTSPYNVFYKEYGSIKKSDHIKMSGLTYLCKAFGKSATIDDIKKKCIKEKEKLKKIYPLLNYVSSHAPELVVIQYIKLIDKQENLHV